MKPTAVVVTLDEVFDIATQVITIAVLVGIDLLVLERFHKAFATGIVIRICRTAHTRKHLVFPQNRHVVAGGILYAAIGVMHQARWGCRSATAFSSAAIARLAANVQSSAHPTTLREKASRITAR